MKKILLTLFFVFSIITFAQGNYEKQMLQNISQLNSAKSVEDFSIVKNNFASIAGKGKGNTNWQPYYYTALSYLKEGDFLFKNNQRELANDNIITALKYLKPILEKEKDNAEINILLGILYAYRMHISPNENTESIGKVVEQYIEKSEKLDPNNPRLSLLKADFKYFSSENKTEAVALYKETVKKFNSYKSKNKIDPNWGKSEAEYYISLHNDL